jgi:hypothetical protein
LLIIPPKLDAFKGWDKNTETGKAQKVECVYCQQNLEARSTKSRGDVKHFHSCTERKENMPFGNFGEGCFKATIKLSGAAVRNIIVPFVRLTVVSVPAKMVMMKMGKTTLDKASD